MDIDINKFLKICDDLGIKYERVPKGEGGINFLQEDNHHKRMEQILKNSDSINSSILSYISGYLGNDEKFEEAFESALMDGILIDFGNE